MTANGIGFETVNYLEEPLSADALQKLLQSAGLKAKDAIRTNEAAYRQHVAGQDLNDKQLIQVMARHPELVQRPIVVRGNKAVLARSSDKLMELGIKGND